MASYAATLKPLIQTILKNSDLSTISAKGVRKNLISRGHDEATIKTHRSEIDEIISGIYDELTAADGHQSDSSEEKPLVTGTPSGSGSGSRSAGATAAAAHPPSSVPRPLHNVKREGKVKTKAEISDSDGEGEGGQDDEAYARQLQSEYNSYGSRPSRTTSTRPKAKKAVVKKKKRSAAVVDSGDEDGEPKKKRAAPNTAFNKDLILSDTLAALVGEPRLSRPQTVKRIWDYVKERELQDPSDKRFIVCDEPLRSVFHTDRLHMFTMNKILAKHFMDPADVIAPKDEPAAAVKKDEPEVEYI